MRRMILACCACLVLGSSVTAAAEQGSSREHGGAREAGPGALQGGYPGTPRVFTLPVTLPTGYTATMTINIYNPDVAAALARYLERAKTPEYGFSRCADCDSGGGGWTDAEIYDSVMRFVSFSCAVAGASAQVMGYVNIWLDAATALCASVSIVTDGEKLLATLWNATLNQANAYALAHITLTNLGPCGVNPQC